MWVRAFLSSIDALFSGESDLVVHNVFLLAEQSVFPFVAESKDKKRSLFLSVPPTPSPTSRRRPEHTCIFHRMEKGISCSAHCTPGLSFVSIPAGESGKSEICNPPPASAFVNLMEIQGVLPNSLTSKKSSLTLVPRVTM